MAPTSPKEKLRTPQLPVNGIFCLLALGSPPSPRRCPVLPARGSDTTAPVELHLLTERKEPEVGLHENQPITFGQGELCPPDWLLDHGLSEGKSPSQDPQKANSGIGTGTQGS